MRRPCVGRSVVPVREAAGAASLPKAMSEPVLNGIPVISSHGEEWLEVVRRQVSALRFGSVEITIHEGRVVQIETSTKVRFDKPR
jgi:hypothetical protein